MDPEDLRKSLIEENKRPESAPVDLEVLGDTADLAHMMRTEAARINAAFVSTADSSERRRIRERYAKLDAWLTEFQQLATLDAPDAAARRDTLRATVLEEMRAWRMGGEAERVRRKDIETERKHLNERAKAGAGAATHKRIKDEIEHLLKNYSPSNESKIETLIDKWRRSGDPNYDPSVKIRLRNARRKKDSSEYAR